MRIVSLLIFASFLWSCSSLKMQKASDVEEIKGQAIVYQLPQNQIDVEVELTKTTFVSGPYSEYSKTYLEIEPLQRKVSEVWRISGVNMQVVAISDTSHTYLLMGAIDKLSASNLSQLSNNSSASNNSKGTFKNYSKPQMLIPYFNELSLKKLIIEDKKTSYKEVTVDSISKRIPIVNIVVRNKNTEEMAKDAAKTLAKIRKRKFRLIAGLNDKFPKKGDIELMIEELDKKEKYYLELFMGYSYEEKSIVSISVLPSEYKKYYLFKFNVDKGVVDSSLLSQGRMIELNFEPYSSVEDFDISSKIKKTENLLPYRIPKKVNLSVIANSKTIYENQVQLAQFGQISYLPLNLLKNSKIKIEQKTGAIIGIE